MYQRLISVRGRKEGSIGTIIYFYFRVPPLKTKKKRDEVWGEK